MQVLNFSECCTRVVKVLIYIVVRDFMLTLKWEQSQNGLLWDVIFSVRLILFLYLFINQ